MTRVVLLIATYAGSLLAFMSGAFGQGTQRVYTYLNYIHTDASRYLEAELKYRDEGTFVQLTGVEVDFYNKSDTDRTLLGQATTGIDGKARIDVVTSQMVFDTAGLTVFEVVFAGDETFKRTSKEISVITTDLNLEAEVRDSVNILTVTGKYYKRGKAHLMDAAEVSILVKRLYSQLPVLQGTLEEGKLEMEFPGDLPGDAFGELWITARISDHGDYGTLETSTKVDWGTLVPYDLSEKRALWSRDAPLWIVVAVSVAFVLAWAHYFFSVVKLLTIRKL